MKQLVKGREKGIKKKICEIFVKIEFTMNFEKKNQKNISSTFKLLCKNVNCGPIKYLKQNVSDYV